MAREVLKNRGCFSPFGAVLAQSDGIAVECDGEVDVLIWQPLNRLRPADVDNATNNNCNDSKKSNQADDEATALFIWILNLLTHTAYDSGVFLPMTQLHLRKRKWLLGPITRPITRPTALTPAPLSLPSDFNL